MVDRERWCGDRYRVGIFQRLGGVLMGMSFVVIFLGCQFAPSANFVYAVMVTAHALLYTGFLIAIADAVARRSFSWVRLVLVLSVALCYMISGPVLMSAVATAKYHQS